MENSIACATFAVIAGTGHVVVPISQRLSISSVILALEKFKDWRLLNTTVVFTDRGCCVEYLFQEK